MQPDDFRWKLCSKDFRLVLDWLVYNEQDLSQCSITASVLLTLIQTFQARGSPKDMQAYHKSKFILSLPFKLEDVLMRPTRKTVLYFQNDALLGKKKILKTLQVFIHLQFLCTLNIETFRSRAVQQRNCLDVWLVFSKVSCNILKMCTEPKGHVALSLKNTFKSKVTKFMGGTGVGEGLTHGRPIWINPVYHVFVKVQGHVLAYRAKVHSHYSCLLYWTVAQTLGKRKISCNWRLSSTVVAITLKGQDQDKD